MKFENTVESSDFSHALQGAKVALNQLGYRLESDSLETWVYKRGNFWSALLATSPKSCQLTVILERISSGLSIKLIVDRKVALPVAVRYWEQEIAHIRALAAGEYSEVESVKFDRPPILKISALMIVLPGIFLALGAILAMTLQLPLSIIYVFAGIGFFLAQTIVNRMLD
jgi:hypothetical protein